MLKANSKKVLDIIATQTKRDATKAYREVHPAAKPDSAKVAASQLLAKPEAQVYLKEHVNRATETVVELMTSSTKDDIRLRSAIDVLDRNHGRAVQKVQQTTTGISINIDLASALAHEPTGVEDTTEPA